MITREKYSVIRTAIGNNVFEMERCKNFLIVFSPENNLNGVLRQCDRLEEYAENITRLSRELRDEICTG